MYTKRKQQRKNSRSGRGKTQRGGEDPPVTNTPNNTSGPSRFGSLFSSAANRLKDRVSNITNSDAVKTLKQDLNTAESKLSAVTGQISDKFEGIEKGITTHRDLPATVEALQKLVEALHTRANGLDQVIKILLTFDMELINLFRWLVLVSWSLGLILLL